MSDEEKAPMDATAAQAEEVLRAALAWRWRQSEDSVYSKEEWELIAACNNYGDKYKGLRGQ